MTRENEGGLTAAVGEQVRASERGSNLSDTIQMNLRCGQERGQYWIQDLVEMLAKSNVREAHAQFVSWPDGVPQPGCFCESPTGRHRGLIAGVGRHAGLPCRGPGIEVYSTYETWRSQLVKTERNAAHTAE